MRILHTGDWHMNDRLGRVSRAADILRSLERIAGYLESEAVDVMIVAGDLFCDKSSKEDLRVAVAEIERLFGPFLARGGTIVAVSGNHDSETFIQTLRDTLKLAPAVNLGATTTSPGVSPSGRLYLYPMPGTLRLADRSGAVVQFALMPYPTARWLTQAGADAAQNPDSSAGAAWGTGEQNLTRQARFTRVLSEKIIPSLDEKLPTVLISHILVSGVQTRAGYRLSIEDDVAFAPGEIPTGWAYVAYGHIHAPQEAIPGGNAPYVRYCGSVERLDAGEANDDKSVVIVDIGPCGRVGEPRLLPLPDTSPFLFLTLGESDSGNPEPDLVALEREWSEKPDQERARYLVRYILHYRYGHDRLDDLRRRLHALFPRIYAWDLSAVRMDEEGRVQPKAAEIDLARVSENVTAYVEQAIGESAPDRADLLAALRTLLDPGEEIPPTVFAALSATAPASEEVTA